MLSEENTDNITDIVAIDGPAGAGKSTVARCVADRLGFAFLDTGAMYRAATWRAITHGVSFDDSAAVAESTRAMRLEMTEENGAKRIYVDGEEVTDAIRSPEVTRQIYRLDENAEVRAHLVALQRAAGAVRPTVAEGRDIGTVVFPKAKCKVFMDASIDERARRRAAELARKNTPVDLATLREEIRIRDEKNRTRAIAPLRCAEDAILIDTTTMTIDEVVEKIVALARAVL